MIGTFRDTFSMTSVEDAVSNTQLPTLLPSPINQRTEASEGQIVSTIDFHSFCSTTKFLTSDLSGDG
jgi:hypothetical protein